MKRNIVIQSSEGMKKELHLWGETVDKSFHIVLVLEELQR